MAQRQRRHRDWPAILAAHQASGLSVAAFCRRHSLHVSHFYHHRRQASCSAAAAPTGFVELTAAVQERASSSGLALVAGPWRIEVEPDFDADTLARLCACLGLKASCSP